MYGKLGDQHSGSKAIILKHILLDGKVKIFEDSKGIAQKIEIFAPEGTVIVYKDIDMSGKIAKYSKIDILSVDEEPRGFIEVYPKDRTLPHPVYRFFYNKAEIGSGYGDIGLFIAEKLLGTGVGSQAQTSIDEEIITTIKNTLQSKNL